MRAGSIEVADLRIHGTTHERPIDRFANEALTPLGTRPPYHYERVTTRRVANNALVTIGSARYSVPVEFVGQTVIVQEGGWTLRVLPPQRLIARHQKAARYSVVMEPKHYAGLLRADGNKSVGSPPPRFDPYLGGLGEVMVRDLKAYDLISQNEGGEAR